VFDSLILTKDSLKQALDAMSQFIWEDTDNSNVVHYKRVPFFIAQEGRAQFVERHAHMLAEGAVDDLAMLIVDHYGVDKSEALNDIEIHGLFPRLQMTLTLPIST
jgi:hypothetical protein